MTLLTALTTHQKNEEILELIRNPLFKQMLDSLSSGICITDLSGTVLFSSQKAYDLYDIENKDGIEGRKIDEIFLTGKTGTLDTLESGRPNMINSVFVNGIEGVARRYPIMDAGGNLIGCLSEVLTTTRDTRLDDMLQSFQQIKQMLIEKNTKHSGLASSIDSLIGESQALKNLTVLGKRFAKSEQPVLIIGESGTGKELLARALHKESQRSQAPFISVNCAALPHDLADSELFGYVEGSFTGSKKGGRKGLFEAADKGTIFLDEIGELPLPIQAKLLRVLESKEIQKIGTHARYYSDFRLIAATNRNIPKMIQEGEFREDLWHRLNVLELRLPPLRERMEDLPLLITHFMERICGSQKAIAISLSPELLKMFTQYHWPGNVRELKNVLTYACYCLDKGARLLTPEHLPDRVKKALAWMPTEEKAAKPAPLDMERPKNTERPPAASGMAGDRWAGAVQMADSAQGIRKDPPSPPDGEKKTAPIPLQDMKGSMEKEGILTALNMAGGNKSKAAQMLGISRNTLYLKMKAYGIPVRKD